MANDTIAVNEGSEQNIRTDKISTVHYQVTKLAEGAEGTANYVSDSNPLPVEQATSQTIKRAVINASSSGDNTVVAAVASKKIKVIGALLVASGDVDVRFEDGAGGSALTGVMSLAADGNGFVLPQAFPGFHWFETSVNTLLNLELSAAVQVSGCLVYYEEA
jgi:hypothetical protein